MGQNIREKIVDYLSARDIYTRHIRYENKVREAMADDTQLSELLDLYRPLKYADVVVCSLIPNLIESCGLGLSLYYQSPDFAIVFGTAGEIMRGVSRRAARKRLEFNEQLMDFPIKMTAWADRICHNIQEISNRLDEGEEWKRQ